MLTTRRMTAAVISAFIAMPLTSAYAADSFSGLRPQEDGVELARGYGSFGYNNTRPSQDTDFRDTNKDGDGAYAEAQFQKWTKFCPPRNTVCYYNWGARYPEQTDRIGVGAGWESRKLSTDRRGAKWRDMAKICVDQSFSPDPCASSRWLYP